MFSLQQFDFTFELLDVNQLVGPVFMLFKTPDICAGLRLLLKYEKLLEIVLKAGEGTLLWCIQR